MRPQVYSQTGVGTSGLAVFDHYPTPFNVSIGVVVSGAVTYTIQHTFDDVNASGYLTTTGTWFPHDNADLVNSTTNQNDNYAYNVVAARINVSAGTGTVTATFIQAGQY